ncbi:MAG: hypothetical protein ACFFCW_20740 [Candidatus Hodarchaeota archaeon]
MKRSEILIDVRDYIEDEDKEDYPTDAPLNRFIQTAADEVAAIILALDESHYIQDHDIGFMIQANVELYDLPDECVRLKYVEDESGVPLTRKNVADRADYIGTGNTRYYYFQDKQIGFLDVPAASKIFPFKFVRKPTAMTSDDSEPDTPEYLCHKLIGIKAAMIAMGISEDDDTWLNKLANWHLKQIEETYFRRNTDFQESVPDDDNLDLD